jgi:hypothetical protein
MECYERICCGLGLDYLGFWNGACQRVLEYIFCSNHFWVLERIFGGRKTNADGGVAMTGFNSKRGAAADKLQEPVEFDAFLESQDFYELMQTYRHCQIDAHIPFEAVKYALHAVHIEAALAQPAQDSVTWFGIDFAKQYAIPAQEPVAFITKGGTGELWWSRSFDEDGRPNAKDIPLYTTPPKREWIGLTPEETSGFTQHEMTVVKYVSKVLQEKNT